MLCEGQTEQRKRCSHSGGVRVHMLRRKGEQLEQLRARISAECRILCIWKKNIFEAIFNRSGAVSSCSHSMVQEEEVTRAMSRKLQPD